MMRRGPVGAAARPLRRIFGAGTVAGLAEWELLRRYLERGDEDAFAAIVARHGPMVLGACRRVLADPADADDAFQVTFLTLARKAASLGESDAIGPWLYGVALRVALRARAEAARRRSVERQTSPAAQASGDLDRAERREAGSAVAEEVAALPLRYRAPVMLCYLEGLTHEDAARQLGWPIGTVKGRLARARDLLRGRLARRGLAPTEAPALMALIRGEAARVPAALASRATRAALDFAAARGAEVVSATAAALLRDLGGEAMLWNKWKAALTALLVLGTGAGALAYQMSRGRGDGPPGARDRPAVPRVEAAASTTPDPLAHWRAEAMQPPTLDAKTRAIFAKLDEAIAMNFPNDTPLEDVMKYIAQSTQDKDTGLPQGIPIYVDPKGLQDVNATMASTVTINLNGVPLKDSLRLLLHQRNLGYRVADGLMVITDPRDVAEPDTPTARMTEKALRGEFNKEELEALIDVIKLQKQLEALTRKDE